ncbi:MAG TPA: carboxypeptidase-like regulatory domain-containing protein, partial [Cytophagaceae bacterium]|nr:carboxypeptidase-like regulatory domain-containing protein [Cytophagaceae bacterium]
MKQKSFILYFLLFASFAVIVQSCKKETGPTGATGPVGPTLTGTASGFASLYDEYGSKLFTNLSNTKVYIIGASDTVYTDTTGKFNFTNLKTGTYNLTFSKSGFGSVNKNVNFIGDSTFLSDTRLSAVPTFTVVSPLNVTISGTTATITGNISAVPSYTAQVVVYVGSSVPTPTSYLLS